jgi:hypothetical protein
MTLTTNETPVIDVPDNDTLLDSIDDRLILVERAVEIIAEQVAEIHTFCSEFKGLLESFGQNPMLAAMLPPGVFG